MLSTLHVGAGTPKGSLRYESASKSKSLLTLGNKKTCAQRGHMTFVPRTFPSGNNEPALSSPHLWFSSLFFFFFYFVLKNKGSSDHSGLQIREC